MSQGVQHSDSVRHYDFIDALRGYAILGVIAVHASQVTPKWEGFIRRVIDQGQEGVQLFFVASALTLMMSWQVRQDGVWHFYVRRFFRIAPMFWLAIFFFECVSRFTLPATQVFLSASFLHGWHPNFFPSVVRGGWSIAVEMMFYVFFPLMAICIRGIWSAIFAFLAANILAYKILFFCWHRHADFWPGVPDAILWNFLHLWFPAQIPVFLVGFVLFYLLEVTNIRLPKWLVNTLLLLSVMMMVGMAIPIDPWSLFGEKLSLYTVYGMCFGVFAFSLAKGAFPVLVNRFICVLGKISFSAYLWHFFILTLLELTLSTALAQVLVYFNGIEWLFFCGFFPALVLLTAFFSSFTYRWVERPMIRFGNRLLQ